MQRSGLEWFFRLCTEPRRLWKRYMINNPLFCFCFAMQFLGIWSYAPAADEVSTKLAPEPE